METQVAKTNSGVPSTEVKGASQTSNLGAEDIVIPRLHLLQAMSKVVADRQGQAGDIYHTRDMESLGGSGTPVNFLPFHVLKVLQRYNANSSPKEYIETIAWDQNVPFEQHQFAYRKFGEQTDTVCTVNNYTTHIVHGILTNPDDPKMIMPVSITFKSSSGKGVKNIASHFAEVDMFNAQMNLSEKPYEFTWDLDSALEKGQSGSFSAWKCKKSRKATENELRLCELWVKAISDKALQYANKASEEEQAVEGTYQEQAPMPQAVDVTPSYQQAPHPAEDISNQEIAF